MSYFPNFFHIISFTYKWVSLPIMECTLSPLSVIRSQFFRLSDNFWGIVTWIHEISSHSSGFTLLCRSRKTILFTIIANIVQNLASYTVINTYIFIRKNIQLGYKQLKVFVSFTERIINSNQKNFTNVNNI